MPHIEATIAALAMPHIERGAKRCAVIARGRLDIQIGKWRLGADFPVRHTVHRAPPGQTQSGDTYPGVERPQDLERRFFVHLLQGGSDRLVALSERILRLS